jgi:hypothetical protein
MVPPTLRLVVDWVHIRDAERRGRRVTPVALALAEQTRFRAGQITPEAVVVIDDLTGAPVRYAPHPSLAAYLRRFATGEPVTPAEFVLELLA